MTKYHVKSIHILIPTYTWFLRYESFFYYITVSVEKLIILMMFLTLVGQVSLL
jgi:hypothetical protein